MPMQPIPENLPPQQVHMPKAIGSHLNNHQPYPSSNDSHDGDYYGSQSHTYHRRSDGLIGESLGSMRESKTNTWPYRPQNRSASLASDISSQFSNTYGAGAYADSVGNDAEYSRFLAAVKQMKHGGSHYGNHLPSAQTTWSSVDPNLSRGWSMFGNDG